MFPPMDMDGEKYHLKAMNCPHHHKIFKELNPPTGICRSALRNTAPVTGMEQSGELFGLMRVRLLQMNDAHIYCTREQFALTNSKR